MREVLDLLRPLGTVVDPGFDGGDLLGLEAFATFRHGFFILTWELHAAEEFLADLGVLGGGRVETEIAFLNFRAVAFKAGTLQHRIDLLRKIDGGGRQDQKRQQDETHVRGRTNRDA